MRTTIAAIVVFLFCCAGWCADQPRVVVVVAGNISIRDLADPNRPYLRSLLQSSAVGLMNVRTGRPSRDTEPTDTSGMEAGCVSLGAGAMGVAGAEARRASNAGAMVNDVPAESLYRCRTGEDVGRSAIVHTEIAMLQRSNAAASYRAAPGALGSALHKQGIRTAVVGNSDVPQNVHREAVALAMDQTGRVDLGDVSSESLLILDPEAPYGVRSSAEALLDRAENVLERSSFVVVDFGDTYRADSYAQYCTDERADLLRCQAIARLEGFLRRLTPKLDARRDLLIVLSPNPRSFSDLEEERMTPILVRGPGYHAGLLTSPSTRAPGVVTISDVAPTILAHLGAAAPPEMIGRPMSVAAHRRVEDALLLLNLKASKQAQRQPVMRGGSVVQSALVALVTLALVVGASGRLRRLAEWAVLVPVAMPLVMLWMPLIYSGGLVGAVAWLIVLTVLVASACFAAAGSASRALVWLCGLLVATMAVDLLRGAPLISSSIAGYGVVEGARYYGLGNELMGTMLGAVLVGVGLALSKSGIGASGRTAIAAAAFCGLFILIGAPNLGANAGGAIATVPAVAVALLARRGWRPSVRGAALVAAITVLVVGALFGLDSLRSSASQSHVGHAVGLAAEGQASGLALILERKIALNFMLLSTSLWSRLLGLCVVGSFSLYLWGRGRFGDEFLSTEQRAAAVGCCVGVVGAFAFNDSGVVAAATCSVFLWALLAARGFSLSRRLTKTGGLKEQPSGTQV